MKIINLVQFYSSISIIIPAILHGICFWDECKCKLTKIIIKLINLSNFNLATTRRVWLATKNSAIVLVGVLAFILGTYYTLIDLIKALGNDGI